MSLDGGQQPSFSAGDGGGNGVKSALGSAVDEAKAFNASWKEAISEITGALMKEVGILEAKLQAANDAVEKIGKERDNALEAIQLAKGSGPSNADNEEWQDCQNAGFGSDGTGFGPC